MIASSTSAPIAIVKPPSVIVLSVPPNSEITTTPATSESGMATAEMKVVRRLPEEEEEDEDDEDRAVAQGDGDVVDRDRR